MTNHERYFSDINAIAKLIGSYPCPCCRACIYFNGSYCDPELRKWGKNAPVKKGFWRG